MTTVACDERFMAAAIRLSLRNEGRTGTNPSVGALIVRDDGSSPWIAGRGVTALGGRPHAEPQALAEAGDLAHGATAYVTLEPCAHHGRTPPCAEALIAAGVARVVGGADDPDPRVAGRGYAILEAAGIEVRRNVLVDEARNALAGYLTRVSSKRPFVTLKLAMSADGMIGRYGEGQVAITGPVARRQVQTMRAASDAILIGIGTALADDPLLTARLPGLEERSPIRIVLDRRMRLPVASKLVQTAASTPLWLATSGEGDGERRDALTRHGAELIASGFRDGKADLRLLLDSLAARAVSTLMVEGGAAVARAFLEEDFVDAVALFRGPVAIGEEGIGCPLGWDDVSPGFRLAREAQYGDDEFQEWARER